MNAMTELRMPTIDRVPLLVTNKDPADTMFLCEEAKGGCGAYSRVGDSVFIQNHYGPRLLSRSAIPGFGLVACPECGHRSNLMGSSILRDHKPYFLRVQQEYAT